MKNSLIIVVLFCVGSYVCSNVGEKVQLVDISKMAETSSRIIGGTPTPIQKYPFAVQVIRGTSLVCGGSLLTRRIVLTAAHCFFDQDGSLVNFNNFRIRAGTTNNNSGGTLLSVSRLVIHERYNTPVRDNDIALMKTTSQFTLGISIGLAFIPYQNNVVPDNSSLTHIGWGTTSVTSSQPSSVLMEVTVRKINHALCIMRYAQLAVIQSIPFPVTTSMLCAGLLDVGGADACQGDSGSALLFNGNIVVGVTSWGWGCGHPFYPGVNARIASYSNWINTTVTYLNGSSPLSESRIILMFTFVCAMFNAY